MVETPEEDSELLLLAEEERQGSWASRGVRQTVRRPFPVRVCLVASVALLGFVPGLALLPQRWGKREAAVSQATEFAVVTANNSSIGSEHSRQSVHPKHPKHSNHSSASSGGKGTRLFCWSHIEKEGTERTLLSSQLEAKFGIFACDGFTVISRSEEPLELGPDPRNKGQSIKTLPSPMPPDRRGNPATGDATASFVNARTFARAWEVVMATEELWKHDWVVKCDADAVFYPFRLRWHVEAYTKPPRGPGPYFLLNCNIDGGKLYGALEVFSVAAVKELHERGKECEAGDSALPIDHWGEDLYIWQCMLKLNGPHAQVHDYNLVGDSRCIPAPCTDGYRAAFHPMKSIREYWDCAQQAVHAR